MYLDDARLFTVGGLHDCRTERSKGLPVMLDKQGLALWSKNQVECTLELLVADVTSTSKKSNESGYDLLIRVGEELQGLPQHLLALDSYLCIMRGRKKHEVIVNLSVHLCEVFVGILNHPRLMLQMRPVNDDPPDVLLPAQ